MSNVFQSAKGRLWHIVHETLSSNGETRTICNELTTGKGRRKVGIADCSYCRSNDNPFALSPGHVSGLHAIAEGMEMGYRLVGLEERDLTYVDKGYSKLTRRGKILAADMLVGAVPVRGMDTLVHKRRPLSRVAACNGYDVILQTNLSTDSYAKLRLVAEKVTCMRCVTLHTI